MRGLSLKAERRGARRALAIAPPRCVALIAAQRDVDRASLTLLSALVRERCRVTEPVSRALAAASMPARLAKTSRAELRPAAGR